MDDLRPMLGECAVAVQAGAQAMQIADSQSAPDSARGIESLLLDGQERERAVFVALDAFGFDGNNCLAQRFENLVALAWRYLPAIEAVKLGRQDILHQRRVGQRLGVQPVGAGSHVGKGRRLVGTHGR